MQLQNPKFTFHDAEPFAFLYENAHLVLLRWERDQTNFLFLIRHQTATGEFELAYPGATFTDTVLDAVLPIFFVKAEEEGYPEPKHYILGSYFLVGDVRYGAYYERADADGSVVLFQILGDAPNLQLEVPGPAEFELAATAFAEQHADFMNIRQLRGGTQ